MKSNKTQVQVTQTEDGRVQMTTWGYHSKSDINNMNSRSLKKPRKNIKDREITISVE